jgi:hypothetical protein
MRWDSIGGSFRYAHQTRCGDAISNMARCGAETLLDGDAVLECPVPIPYNTTHGIVRPEAQKLALDGFPRVQ